MTSKRGTGNRRKTKRRLRPCKAVREMKRPAGITASHVAILIPETTPYEVCSDWVRPKSLHNEIIATVREWGTCRVISHERWRTRRTRIYLNEPSLVMLKAAYPDAIWKMYRLID